jgi:Protein of unknown function (DUF1254)
MAAADHRDGEVNKPISHHRRETTMRSALHSLVAAALALTLTSTVMAQAPSHYDELANLPFRDGYVAKDKTPVLLDELFFQRAVQTYLWALPALNMYGMKEGSAKIFGSGYNVLPIFKQRLNAKTLITTPNSDVIYALGFVDLKETGPLVIEVPPGLQGILDDYFHSARFVRWARSTGASGPATWVCPALIGGMAESTSFCRPTIKERFPKATSPTAAAPMACSSSGAASSRIRTNSPNLCA